MFRFKRNLARLFAWPRLETLWLSMLNIAAAGLGYHARTGHSASGEAYLVSVAWGLGVRRWIDVGAHDGSYSSVVLALPDTEVVAIEPLPAPFQRLKKLLATHPFRFSCHRVALGSMGGEALLAWPKGMEKHAEAIKSGSPSEGQQEHVAKLETLDDSFFRDFEGATVFLKLDVEGGELGVLRGARRILKSCPPAFIQVEFTRKSLVSGESIAMMADFLTGYECFQLLPERRGVRPRRPDRAESNLRYYSNFVFVRRDFASRMMA